MSRKRSIGTPTTTAARAVTPTAAATATGNACPPSHNSRVIRAPRPKNAEWPRLIWPANPPRMFQLVASAARIMIWIVSVRTCWFPTVSPAAIAAARTRRPRSAPAALGTGPPEEPQRSETEDDQEEDERRHLPVLATDPDTGEALDQTQRHACDHDAAHASQPGELHDDEGLQRPPEPDAGADAVAQADHRAGGGGERRRHRERDQIDPAHIDPGEGGPRPVLGCGPQGLSEPRP